MTNITCPYCGAVDDSCVSDLWEFDGDGNEVECASCEKEFTINVHVSYKYEAKRSECFDEKHEYLEWRRFDYEKANYSLWFRDCKHCDESDVHKVGYNSDLPEELKG